MRKPVGLGLTILCVCGAVGCGGTYASTMQRVLKDLNTIRAAYKSIKQKEHLNTGVNKITAAKADLDTDFARLVALEPKSEAEKHKLQKKYYKPLQTIIAQIRAEQNRVSSMEGGKEAVDAAELPEQLIALARDPDEKATDKGS
jgi:hypothetical protein